MTISETKARFWSKVVKAPGPTACWLWKAATFQSGGYGAFLVIENGKKRVTRAHRVAWEWEHGPIPDGLLCCHRCDAPACVRPSHLFIGTDADNVRDKMSKGRYVYPSRESAPKGEDHHWCHLTEENVIAIRERYEAGGETYFSLARTFDVSFTTIAAIVTRRSWKHVL